MPKYPVKTVKYCCSCHRDELHVRLRVRRLGSLVVKIVTLGLAIPLWPYCCTTCGRRRVYHDWVAVVLMKLNPL